MPKQKSAQGQFAKPLPQRTDSSPRARSADQPANLGPATTVGTMSNAPGSTRELNIDLPWIIHSLHNLADKLVASGPKQISPEIRAVGAAVTLKYQVELTIGPGKESDNVQATVSGTGRIESPLELAHELLQHPGQWLRTPNENLGNRKPIDLIDTDEEDKVYYLLNAVKHGLY